MLSDKEIGELWCNAAVFSAHWASTAFIGLIHKLVEERNQKYAAESGGKWDSLHYTARVLDEFGIPEEGWK